jgi:hypothetical protein
MDSVIGVLIGVAGAYILFLIKPSSKEDAKRRALHKLEIFCPPNWGTKNVGETLIALSKLYKELQYASRGNSFILTRAAAWEMKKIIDRSPRSDMIISTENSKELYMWKTLIAVSIGNKPIIPLFTNRQKKFKAKLANAKKHTKWVLINYDFMNKTKIVEDYFHLLEEFEKDLISVTYK